jgi:hypothetical protein
MARRGASTAAGAAEGQAGDGDGDGDGDATLRYVGGDEQRASAGGATRQQDKKRGGIKGADLSGEAGYICEIHRKFLSAEH